jgi:predicted DCC family thiol-disulfide oxidoreductase YuxK
MKSIVFFDDQCSLCRRTINFLHRQDRRHQLQFASLESKTAHRYLSGKHSRLRRLNTVVFLEIPSGRLSIRGRAIFVILGKLGGPWAFAGWMYQLPFIDLFYQLIARHRKRGGSLEPLEVSLLP